LINFTQPISVIIALNKFAHKHPEKHVGKKMDSTNILEQSKFNGCYRIIVVCKMAEHWPRTLDTKLAIDSCKEIVAAAFFAVILFSSNAAASTSSSLQILKH